MMSAAVDPKIRGHEAVLEGLRRMRDQNRVPHALLFCGPEGVGKWMTAQAFVTGCYCEQRLRFLACGVCESCRQIHGGRHPDIQTLGRDMENRSIGIKEIQEVKSFFFLKASGGLGKSVLMDDADRMTAEAQNALLKLLEEPPAGAVIILVTSRYRELLPTVLSRCRRMEFGPLGNEVQARILSETQGLSAEEAARMAPLSDGSMARAALLAERNGADLYERALGLLEKCASGDPMEIEERSSQEREEEEWLLELLTQVLRDAMLVKAGSESGLFMPENRPRLERLAASWGPEKILTALDLAGEAREASLHSGNARLIFDELWLGLGARWL